MKTDKISAQAFEIMNTVFVANHKSAEVLAMLETFVTDHLSPAAQASITGNIKITKLRAAVARSLDKETTASANLQARTYNQACEAWAFTDMMKLHRKVQEKTAKLAITIIDYIRPIIAAEYPAACK